MIKQERRKKRQIAAALQPPEGGASVAEIYRRMGVAEQTFCRWKKRWGDVKVSEPCQLTKLEDENTRPVRGVADSTLGKAVLQEVLTGKPWRWAASKNCPCACTRATEPIDPRRSRGGSPIGSGGGQVVSMAAAWPRDGKDDSARRWAIDPRWASTGVRTCSSGFTWTWTWHPICGAVDRQGVLRECPACAVRGRLLGRSRRPS